MSNISGFEEVRNYQNTLPAPRWKIGPRETTGTIVNSICMSVGGSVAYLLEELSKTYDVAPFSTAADHPIATTISFALSLRVFAYFLRNGGSSAIGDIIVKIYDKVSNKKGKKDVS